jgi:NADH:ubiquinone oxidoreductase subunit E
MAEAMMREVGYDRESCFRQLEDFIGSYAEVERGQLVLIPVLHKAQEIFGYLPTEVQEHVAERLGLSAGEVYGVVTFYHYFSTQPRGRHTVNICLGTACYVRGAHKVLEALQEELGVKLGETTDDLRFSLCSQRCFGSCGLAPVIMVDDEVHGRVTPKKVKAILESYE